MRYGREKGVGKEGKEAAKPRSAREVFRKRMVRSRERTPEDAKTALPEEMYGRGQNVAQNG